MSQSSAIRLVSHDGNQAGASSLLSYSPDKGVVIAIMANLQDVSLNAMAEGIADVILAAKD